MRFRLQKFFALVLTLITFISISAFAQDDSAWYENKPIKSVVFEGLKNIKASDLEGITSSYIGKRFTDEIPNELYNKIEALDYFSDYEIKLQNNDGGRTIKIIIEVSEYPIVSKIVFSGNHQLHDSDLKEAVSIKEKDIFNTEKMLMDQRAIKNHYIDKGFTDANVRAESKQTDEGVVITFIIEENRQTVVKKIEFSGNKVVSSKTLKGKISLKEVGIFNNGAFQETSLSADVKAIVTYYQNRGYVDARVYEPRVESSYNEEKKRQELTITFEVIEGSQYEFGGMSFSGNHVFSEDKLQSFVKLERGKTYNETRFQESKAAIQNLYYENGYTSNRFDARMTKDPELKSISYVLEITENPRSHIEDVIIKGNTKTKEYVIRREIPIESGDIFSNTKVMTGLRNLYNLQYFSAIVPDVLPGSEENLVDLVFSVEEQSTTTLDFGFTFSGVSDPDEFPIALYAKITNSNLFGEGRSISAGVTLSTDEQSVSLSYGQNWLFDLPISSSFSASYSHSKNYALTNFLLPDGSIDNDYYYMEYEQHEFNLSASLGRRWTPDFAILTLTGGISGSLIDNIYNSSLFVPYDASVSQYNNNWEPKNSLWASFSVDNRNINYDPSSGWFLNQRLAWYGLLPAGTFSFLNNNWANWGEKEFYLRTDTKGEIYFTLLDQPFSENWSLKLILMGYSSLSMQFPLPNTTIKQSNQLYIDGMFNGRGWTIYNTAAGRGLTLWSNTLELRCPVVPGVFAIDLWFDAICIADSIKEFYTQMNQDMWYFSFGPSLRFAIQQFPLRLLFVNTFKVKDGQLVFLDQDGGEGKPWYKNFNFVLSFNLVNK